MRSLVLAAGVLCVGSSASWAQLVDHRTDTDAGGATVDGTLGADEYGPGNSYSYAGGGDGFGGTLGRSSLYMNSDASRLFFGFQPGSNVNDLVTILLDTRAGGFTDAGMDDQGDGGRRASSNLNANADDAFAPRFRPDFSIVIGNFGIVAFELTSGPLNFLNFDGTFTGSDPTFREYGLDLSALGLSAGDRVDFFAAYIADSGFGSNESLPAGPINAGPNIGFDTVSPGYPTFNRFTVVPGPGAVLVGGLGVVVMGRRRRG